MSMYSELSGPHKGKVVGFMCKTDWEFEIGGAADGSKVYPDMESVKKCCGCWKGCGIVKVAVECIETVLEGIAP